MELSRLDAKVSAILKREGRLRYSEIQRISGIREGSLTKVLKRLVEEGYLIRELETDGYPPSVYYRLNPEKVEKLTQLLRKEAEEDFVALMSFDPDEARKLLDELWTKLR